MRPAIPPLLVSAMLTGKMDCGFESHSLRHVDHQCIETNEIFGNDPLPPHTPLHIFFRLRLDILTSRVATFYDSKQEVAVPRRAPSGSSSAPVRLAAEDAGREPDTRASGDRPKVEKIIEFIHGQPGATDVVLHMEERLAAGTDDVPYFPGLPKRHR